MNTATQHSGAALRVLCLGDSITDGFWLPGGYRNTLCRLLEQSGLSEHVVFTGPNRSGDCYDGRHAGFCAHSVDPIAASISGPRAGISDYLDSIFSAEIPDAVLLQIGTNDILSLYDLAHFGARLSALTDRILAALPAEGALYLATLPAMDARDPLYIEQEFFTVQSMDEAVALCNRQIREIAAHADSRLRLADVHSVLTKADLHDGVHPSAEGYEKLGTFWYHVLLSELRRRALCTEAAAIAS